MNNDLIVMIGNLSQSLLSVMSLFSGLGYAVGLLFVIKALMKLKSVGESKSGSHESVFIPLVYFFLGAALLFLPSMVNLISNSSFGTGNILQYAQYKPHDIYAAMGLLIQAAGVVWFLRGCVLMAHSSHPGVEHGAKGLIFIISGILAMNFQETMAALDYIMNELLSMTFISPTGGS